MASKKYDIQEEPMPVAAEPMTAYGYSAPFYSGRHSIKDVAAIDGLDDTFAKLKAEADASYGVKDRMTVDEYFGKLRYMVNTYYDSL